MHTMNTQHETPIILPCPVCRDLMGIQSSVEQENKIKTYCERCDLTWQDVSNTSGGQCFMVC